MTMPATEEEPVRCTCGRALRDPVSRARGQGPVCWRRLHQPGRRPYAPRPPATPGPEQPELPYDDQLTLWKDSPC